MPNWEYCQQSSFGRGNQTPETEMAVVKGDAKHLMRQSFAGRQRLDAAGENSLPAEEKKDTKEEKKVTKEEKKVPMEEKKVPMEEEKVPMEEKKVPMEEEKVPMEEEKLP